MPQYVHSVLKHKLKHMQKCHNYSPNSISLPPKQRSKVQCHMVDKHNANLCKGKYWLWSISCVEAEVEEEEEGWSPSLCLLKYSSDSLRACLLIVTHGAGERSEKEEERGGWVQGKEEKLGRWAMLPVCMSANSQTWSASRGRKNKKRKRGCLNSPSLKSQGMDHVKKQRWERTRE